MALSIHFFFSFFALFLLFLFSLFFHLLFGWNGRKGVGTEISHGRGNHAENSTQSSCSSSDVPVHFPICGVWGEGPRLSGVFIPFLSSN